MIKSEKLLFSLSVIWSTLLLALGTWWAYLIVSLASGSSKYNTSRLTSMVLWEGGTFLILLLASSITLLFIYLKDKKRTKALQGFFSSLTHELKTPLASIRLQGEVIHDKIKDIVGSNGDIEKLTNRLIQDTNRLETQMDKILQLSRLERGGNLNLVSVNLIDYLRRLEKDWGKSFDLTFNFTIEKEESYIDVDQFALDLIFKNLLENTQIHSNDNKIKIILSDFNNTILLKYSDGGVFDGDQKKLGNIFYKHSSTKGSGIGLYLIKNLLLKMQGDFKFEIDATEELNKLNFYLWFKKSRGSAYE